MKASELRNLIREEISKVLKENQLSDIVNQLMNAPKGSKATGGGYGPFIKISSNSWKNTKSNSLQHSRALADFIGGFNDFKISSSANESKLRPAIHQFIKEESSTSQELFNKLESLLKTHDWTYFMSDDHRAYKRGDDQHEEIKDLMKQLKNLGYEEKVKKLYSMYKQ